MVYLDLNLVLILFFANEAKGCYKFDVLKHVFICMSVIGNIGPERKSRLRLFFLLKSGLPIIFLGLFVFIYFLSTIP